jgi:hypothetical protein
LIAAIEMHEKAVNSGAHPDFCRAIDARVDEMARVLRRQFESTEHLFPVLCRGRRKRDLCHLRLIK